MLLPQEIRKVFPKDKPKAILLWNLYKSLHERAKQYCCVRDPKRCRFL